MGVDRTQRGSALRDARLARALSLHDAAGADIDISELARLEGGQAAGREVPDPVLLRLGLTEEYLPSSESVARACTLEAAVRGADWPTVAELLPHIPTADAGFYAGLLAEGRGDLAEALDTLGLWIDATPGPSFRRLRGIIAFCRCARDEGELAQAIDRGEHGLAEAAEDVAVDVEALAELRNTLSGVYCLTGDLERALSLTEPLPTAAGASAWAEVTTGWARAMVLHTAGDIDAARDVAFTALAKLRPLNRPASYARLQNTAAWLALQSRVFDADQMHEILSESAESIRQRQSPVASAMVISSQAELAARAGEATEARRLLTEALRHIESDAAGNRARVLAACAQVYGSMGDIDEAVRLLLLARQLLEDSGAKRSAAATWRQMADIYTTLQQPDLALACMQAAMDLLEL